MVHKQQIIYQVGQNGISVCVRLHVLFVCSLAGCFVHSFVNEREARKFYSWWCWLLLLQFVFSSVFNIAPTKTCTQRK